MKRLINSLVVLAVTALMSGSAFATIDYSDDFESYNLPDGGVIGGGWNWFLNGWTDSDGTPGFPTCDTYAFSYDPTQHVPKPNAPNSNGTPNWAVSNIAVGATGKALNVFSDYGNQDYHLGGDCLETIVFQETVFAAADAGNYTFSFDVQVPEALGEGVTTFAFVKLLDPNAGYADVFGGAVKEDTATAGTKSIDVTLAAAQDGMILQWGFTNIASYNRASSRWYDNVSFAPEVVVPPPVKPPVKPPEGNYEGIPIPPWALFIMIGMLAYLGATKLRSQRKS